jgi:hypothetical protein
LKIRILENVKTLDIHALANKFNFESGNRFDGELATSSCINRAVANWLRISGERNKPIQFGQAIARHGTPSFLSRAMATDGNHVSACIHSQAADHSRQAYHATVHARTRIKTNANRLQIETLAHA